MRGVLAAIFMLVALSVSADERGELRLQRISRHYSAMGNYSVSFVLRVGGGEQRGFMQVEGNNLYLKVADTELFVADSVRYEVRVASKEIIIDRADAYEKELLNPLNGFSGVNANYMVEESNVDGRIVVKLTPKQLGETIYIITGADGESIAKVQYGAGDGRVDVVVDSSRKSTQKLPIFSKERYKGFELIDFR